MTAEIGIVLAALALAVFLFVTEKLRVDVVALLVMALLLVSGIITPSQGLSGFSNAATLTVGAMFVLSAGLFKTGAVSFLGELTGRVFKSGFWFGIIVVMLIVGVLSAFINNTPVIAIFLPILLGVARENGISASKILMPVSFASMFGGVCTLIGTSTNILVSSIAQESGLRPFTMFEFTPLGLIMFVVGTAYMLIFGIRLIPERRGSGDLVEDFSLNEYLTEVVLQPDSISVGKHIREAPLVKDLELSIVKIERDDKVIQVPSPNEILRAFDVLLVRCDIEQIRSLQEQEGVLFKAQNKWGDETITSADYRLIEAVLLPTSRLVGSTLMRSNFRERFDATVLAIRHKGRLLRQKLSDTELSAGDVLLVEIKQDRIPNFRRSGDFIITSEMERTEFRRNKALLAIAIVAAVVLGATFELAPIVVTAILGAIGLILLGCISVEEAYEAIEWKIIFLLAGVLSLGVALEQSGAAALLSSNILKYVGVWGPIALVSAFYLLTSILTETMSNNATAALLAPIAIATAKTLELDATPFLMAITFAASASFMTPVGYQTNTMIYGPGQYKFVDFVKIGSPLNLMFWIIATIAIPVIWPF
ncbi:SLC13 family permease [Leptolyngbya sp. 7M]|uniref:SLC13 family permease n=1 Tax=Leptolyngbya sp. 7M TaxID=2812896 RepID=UPI001B8D26D2|nr:SLC13 family permease [Leptolyngbya sp. 7M]QYO67096.1 SLC13 family permease [Leptolyngbya sp. 7M]